MPTRVVSSELMGIGKKEGGKHWTRAQVEARAQAAEGLKRTKRVMIKAPKWLSADALGVWKQTIKLVRGLDLLDNIDSTLLGVYCTTVVQYRTLTMPKFDEDGKPQELTADGVKAMQAYVRILTQLTDKLGFSPAARARLVKKKADEIIDEFGGEFD